MQSIQTTLALCIVVTIAACDSKPSEASHAAAAARPAGTSKDTKVVATAREVAGQSRGAPSCPPKLATPLRDKLAPVDDVLGVRPGLSYEEAEALVLCTHDLLVTQPETTRRFEMKTYGQPVRQGFAARFAQAKVNKTSKEIIQEMQDRATARGTNRVVREVQPGQSRWYVGTVGLPGQERVIDVLREEWFETGSYPAVDTIDKALRDKYGAPTGQGMSGTVLQLQWAHDPAGRPLSKSSALFGRCNAIASAHASTHFSPECGVVVAAAVSPVPDNPGLGQSMVLRVINQAMGYEAITTTEQKLQQLDAQRQAREVEKAGKQTGAPKI